MARQIIKQPNGKYCIFSTIVDSITDYDMEINDIVDVWVEEYRNEIEAKVKSITDELEQGGRPYYQSTKSFDEILLRIKEIHGDKEVEKFKKLIS